MRQIGTISNQDDAERFSDYLVTRNIENMVEESAAGGAWAVWVEHDDQLDQARAELEGFKNQPSDAKYDASSAAQKLREEQREKQKRQRTKYIDVRTRWGQAQQLAAPVTLTLIALSIAVGVITKVGYDRGPIGDYLSIAPWHDQATTIARHPRHVDEDENPSPGLDLVLHGQVWRLVTPIFLHFGPLHLLFNLFWLLDLGSMVEKARGMWRFLLLVLAIAIISNLAEYYWSGPAFGGLSGVIAGVFGYIWVKQRYEPQLGLGVSQQTAMIIIGWMILCMTGYVGDIANAAHVVGLLTGAAIAYVPYQLKRTRRARGL